MKTFILAVALFGSCLAQLTPNTYGKSLVDYEIPSGKVSYSSNVPVDGVYGQSFGYGSSFRYGQGVRSVYGVQQSEVKPIASQHIYPGAVQKVYGVQPVHEVYPAVQKVNGVQSVHDVYPAVQKVYGVQPVHDQYYNGYVQPAFRYNVPSKVVKPVIPYLHPVADNRQFISQPAVHHVSPVVSDVTYPKVSSYPVGQHTPYVQSFEKFVKPITKYVSPVVQPYTKYSHVSPVARIGHVEPVVPSLKYTSPVVQPAHFRQFSPVVQPAQFRQVAPAYHHDVVAKTHESPAAIIAQSQDTSVDGSFVSNFQTENGIQSTIHGSIKPVAGSDEPAQVMTGSYSYTSPDGTPVVTRWYADENGFHADGDHIPAVPEEIQRSLEYINSYPVAHEDVKYVKHY